jgi:hypothetical protein
MPLSIDYFAMQGGMDVVSPYFKLKPGAMIDCANYECLPEGGYRRIDGYELFDGSLTPQPVPGEGPIRGVWVYAGDTYAIRDQAAEGGFFKGTAAGWEQVDTGHSIDFNNGIKDFEEGGVLTSPDAPGASADIARVIFAGGSNGVGDSFGRLILKNVAGSFSAGNALHCNGIHCADAETAETANTLPKGGLYKFFNHNFFGQDGNARMYGAGGAGEAFEFDGDVFAPIRSAVENQHPKFIVAHKQHLFLCYQTGSIITSIPGEPLIFDAIQGAVEIAIGDTLTTVRSLPGGVLAIGCEESIQMLYGNDVDTWQLQQFADHGIKENSFAEIGGNTLALTNRGLQSIQTSQAYGDFESTSQSRPINPLLLELRSDLSPTTAYASKAKSQYRLYFGREAYYFAYAGNGLAGITRVLMPDTMYCSVSGEDAAGREVIFLGSDDGNVFKANSGYSFNGEPITAFFKVAFNYANSPTTRKQYRKAMIDVQTEGDSAQIFVKPDYDFGKQDVPLIPYSELLAAASGGGIWDFSEWDDFVWAAPNYSTEEVPLAAIARNMALTFVSHGATNGSHTIFGAAIHYSMRRVDR